MKLFYKISIASILLIFILSSCALNRKNVVQVGLKNTSETELTDYPVYIDLKKLQSGLPELTPDNLGLAIDKESIPYQIIRKNGKDIVLTLVNLQPGGSLKLTAGMSGVEKTWKKRSHAEISVKSGGEFVNKKYVGGGEFKPIDSLRVPDECTDHSFYMRYEGPGWESDKVAYRLYLDWRNAIDIFGKLTTDVALPGVGVNDYDSYHELHDWGMDILKVGESLGMGSVGTWAGEKAERVAKTDSVICVIETDGDLYSSFRTNYYNWQSGSGNVDLTVNTSIIAGSRMTKQVITYKGELANLATGIVKTEGIPVIKGPADTEWGYIATWGKQSLNNDNLGMVVFFKNEDVLQITEDELSYVVALKPNDKKVKYYFAALWEKENKNIYDEAYFKKYIEESVITLSKPVTISW